jgi:hypothetical protein
MLGVLLDYPERVGNIVGPHSRHGSDGLWLLAHRELDHDLTVGVPDVDMRRLVFARRQEDQDSKPTYAEHGRHSNKITYLMGYCKNRGAAGSSNVSVSCQATSDTRRHVEQGTRSSYGRISL